MPNSNLLGLLSKPLYKAALICSAAFVVSLFASTASAKTPDLNLDDLKPIGQASLKVLWFDIYDATLLSPTGNFESEALPLALELTYKRKIKSKSLVGETKKQLKGKLDELILDKGLEQLANIWPDINKKDSLTFYLENQNLGHFYYNSNYLGSIDQNNFAQAFIDIWIGEDCQYPELADQLKGLPKRTEQAN